MLQICLKLPDQQFEEPPFEGETLTFLRYLSHSGEIKVITDVNVNKLHQPWRSFAAVINKCLSDYAYLLWEDFVYQVENKNVKRSNEMYYPRFTKVIVNFFMTKDPSILRRNKVNWHFYRDDPMFNTIKVVSRHEDTQLYGAILPDELINEAIKDSESYKEYYAIAFGVEPPKTKASVKKKQDGPDKTKTPLTAKGKRLKTSAKAAKPAKQKQLAKASKVKGLTVLSEKSSDKENDNEVGMSDDDDNDDDDDNNDDNGQEYDGQDDEGQYDDNEQTNSDNNGDDFVYPKFSTHGQEERQDEEDNEEEGSYLRVQTPSHYESIDDEESYEVTQGGNAKGEELNEETYVEEEVNELYRDVNVNLEGRYTEMTDAQQTNVYGFISNMLNLSPDTGIDSILNLNTESTSLVDVPISTTVVMPPSSATTIPPPPVSLIQPLQQTPFEDRVKALEDDFSEFKQTNQFASDRLRDEAQTENADFINKLDDNIKKIIKEQIKAQVKEQVTKILPRIKKTINEQLEAEILTHSSNEAKTSHAVASNLSELVSLKY
ncbi:hypothetical protein Tco_1499269 [Tanacetum coccineum]